MNAEGLYSKKKGLSLGEAEQRLVITEVVEPDILLPRIIFCANPSLIT